MSKILCIHAANITGDTAQTGLVDYASLLSKKQRSNVEGIFLSNCELNTASIPDDWPYVYDSDLSYETMAANFPQKKLTERISELAQEHDALPVVVSHVGVRTGAPIAPETLAQFPVVMISHEFELLNPEQRVYRVAQMLAANRLIFTTDAELQSALESIATIASPEDAELVKQRSIVHPIPTNILPPEKLKPLQERNSDVIVFGTIRERKGLNRIPAIARAMKDDPYFRGRSIHVVGNVLIKNGGRGLDILKNLLTQAFALREGTLQSFTLEETTELAYVLEGGRSLNAEALSPKIVALLSEDFIDRELPLHIHLGQTPEQVSDTLNNSRYSFLPMPRGATRHSGTLAASLEHGMITLVCRSKIEPTASLLRNGCVYILEKAEDVLTTIKAHEAIIKRNTFYEQFMVDNAQDYKQATSWDNLVKLTNRLALEAVEDFKSTDVIHERQLANSLG